MPKSNRGRPNKYLQNVKPRFDEIKEWLKIGATDKEIARKLGVNPNVFSKYKGEYNELSDLLKTGRSEAVQDIKAALFKRATGSFYSEKKTIIEYEEFKPEVKDALIEMGLDAETIGQRKLVRVELMEKYALPDPASAMILLKHWDKNEDGTAKWTQDPSMLELKKEELELKKKHLESEVW